MPDDLPRARGDLVDCRGVTAGNKVVALGVFVDAVNVDVIPCSTGCVAGVGIEREVAICLKVSDFDYFDFRSIFCFLPLGSTCSKLAHSKINFPVLMSSSSDSISRR